MLFYVLNNIFQQRKALKYQNVVHIWPGPRQTKTGPQNPTVTRKLNFDDFFDNFEKIAYQIHHSLIQKYQPKKLILTKFLEILTFN